MQLVSWLAELGEGDRAIAGGKGANLGELLRASLPVPPGFVVRVGGHELQIGSSVSGWESPGSHDCLDEQK
jgi:pyruvate,water dikinase